MNSIIANRIYDLVANDPAKIAILNLLVDGKWHTRFEVESAAKNHRETIGLVGICIILKALQNADSELFEEYENNSGRFYRINPQRIPVVKKIVDYQMKASKEPRTQSAKEFRRFKDKLRNNRKNSNSLDDDLKQFL